MWFIISSPGIEGYGVSFADIKDITLNGKHAYKLPTELKRAKLVTLGDPEAGILRPGIQEIGKDSATFCLAFYVHTNDGWKIIDLQKTFEDPSCIMRPIFYDRIVVESNGGRCIDGCSLPGKT